MWDDQPFLNICDEVCDIASFLLIFRNLIDQMQNETK